MDCSHALTVNCALLLVISASHEATSRAIRRLPRRMSQEIIDSELNNLQSHGVDVQFISFIWILWQPLQTHEYQRMEIQRIMFVVVLLHLPIPTPLLPLVT